MVEQQQLVLSKAGFGCWQLGSKGSEDYWGLEFTQELADDLVSLAADQGITYFDTAEDYGKGASETQLGLAINKLSEEKRKNIVIGSKILPNHCAESEVEKTCEATLARLGIDSIDLYMVHWPISVSGMSHFAGTSTAAGGRDYASQGEIKQEDVPSTAGAFKALKRLQESGKVKHIGVSNFGVKQLKEAMESGVKIAVNQLVFNLLTRAIEMEILPFCKEQGIQVIAYSPLLQGLLTGRWLKTEDIPEYRSRTRHFNSATNAKSRHGEAGQEEILFKTLVNLNKISEKHQIALPDLAVAWPLHVPGVKCVIVGATKASQVLSNSKAANLQLSPELVAELTEATEELKQAMGPNADLWQGKDGRIM